MISEKNEKMKFSVQTFYTVICFLMKEKDIFFINLIC